MATHLVDVAEYLQVDDEGVTLWLDPDWTQDYREDVVASFCSLPMLFTLRQGKRPSYVLPVSHLPTVFIDSEMPESHRRQALKVISRYKVPAKIAILPLVEEDAARTARWQPPEPITVENTLPWDE